MIWINTLLFFCGVFLEVTSLNESVLELDSDYFKEEFLKTASSLSSIGECNKQLLYITKNWRKRDIFPSKYYTKSFKYYLRNEFSSIWFVGKDPCKFAARKHFRIWKLWTVHQHWYETSRTVWTVGGTILPCNVANKFTNSYSTDSFIEPTIQHQQTGRCWHWFLHKIWDLHTKSM